MILNKVGFKHSGWIFVQIGFMFKQILLYSKSKRMKEFWYETYIHENHVI